MFEYINNTYGLNIKKDDLIIYKPDNIKLKVIGAKNAYIKAKPLDTKNKRTYILHPTWEIEYLKEEKC